MKVKAVNVKPVKFLDWHLCVPYTNSMTVTIEVIKPETLNLLRNMESMGLIHVKTSVPHDSEDTVPGDKYAYRKLRGIHKNMPGASVDEFLSRCRSDKERELAMEKRHDRISP